MYVWNTGTMISKHLDNHVNHPKVLNEYYEVYLRQGHVNIMKPTFFKKCQVIVKDSEFMAQLIPIIMEHQCRVTLTGDLSTCSRQYIIDIQGF